MEYWKNGGGPNGYNPLNWQKITNVRPSPDTPPEDGWQRDHGILNGRHGSCIRFVCIQKSFSENGTTIIGQQYCGPTCTNLGLINIASGYLSQASGCFIFAFIFYGWISDETDDDGKTKRKFQQCSDTSYTIYYAQLTKTNT